MDRLRLAMLIAALVVDVGRRLPIGVLCIQPVLIQRFREAASAAVEAETAQAAESIHNKVLNFTKKTVKNLGNYLKQALQRHPTKFFDYKVPGCYS